VDAAVVLHTPPLAGWTHIATLDRTSLDRHLHGVDRRMAEALDHCKQAAAAAGDTLTSSATPETPDEEAAMNTALARPVDLWDMGDGTSVPLPGAFLFAAAVLGRMGDEAHLYEQGRWLCLTTGRVEYLSYSGGDDWRVRIA
jgi:hypothetical protein